MSALCVNPLRSPPFYPAYLSPCGRRSAGGPPARTARGALDVRQPPHSFHSLDSSDDAESHPLHMDRPPFVPLSLASRVLSLALSLSRSLARSLSRSFAYRDDSTEISSVHSSDFAAAFSCGCAPVLRVQCDVRRNAGGAGCACASAASSAIAAAIAAVPAILVVTRRFVDAIAKCGRVRSTRAPRVSPKQTPKSRNPLESSAESAGKEVFCDVARARRLRRWTREGRIS